jgi:hypothetical protein
MYAQGCGCAASVKRSFNDMGLPPEKRVTQKETTANARHADGWILFQLFLL